MVHSVSSPWKIVKSSGVIGGEGVAGAGGPVPGPESLKGTPWGCSAAAGCGAAAEDVLGILRRLYEVIKLKTSCIHRAKCVVCGSSARDGGA